MEIILLKNLNKFLKLFLINPLTYYCYKLVEIIAYQVTIYHFIFELVLNTLLILIINISFNDIFNYQSYYLIENGYP